MAMKLICEMTIGSTTKLATPTTSGDDAAQGRVVLTQPGVGKPFLIARSLPTGHKVVAADLDDAPAVAPDVPTNNIAITALLAAAPAVLQRLTFDPALSEAERASLGMPAADADLLPLFPPAPS